MQSALDTSVSRHATPLSQSHTCTHFLMAPTEDRNGDEWSPSHQSNQKCIFHISVIELCTSCKLMRSSPLQLWQESTNNYLPIFPYVAINLNHWQATAAPPRTSPPSFLLRASAAATFSSARPPPPSLFPRVPYPASRSRCSSAFWLRLRGIDSRLMWESQWAGSGLTWASEAIKALQLLWGWEASRWLSPEISHAGTRRAQGAWEKCQRGHLVPGGEWGGRAGSDVVCLISRDEGRWGK